MASDRLTAGPNNLNIEVSDLLAQGIPVHAKQLGSPNLIGRGSPQEQLIAADTDFPQDAMM